MGSLNLRIGMVCELFEYLDRDSVVGLRLLLAKCAHALSAVGRLRAGDLALAARTSPRSITSFNLNVHYHVAAQDGGVTRDRAAGLMAFG